MSPGRARLVRILVLSLLGFVIYGAWAAYANRAHGPWHSLRAALAQGAMSFVATLVLTTLNERLFRALGRAPAWLRVVVAGLLPTAAVLPLMALGHRLAGTPEILRTIALSGLLGGSYSLAYALGLWITVRRSVRQAGPK